MKITRSVRLYGLFVFCAVTASSIVGVISKTVWSFERMLPCTFIEHLIQELMIIWSDLQILQQLPQDEEPEVVAVESIVCHLDDVNDFACRHYEALFRCGARVAKVEYIIALIHKIKLMYLQKNNDFFSLHSGYSFIEERLLALENIFFELLDACS